jgi:amino-acid N-acetyltransferase
MLLNEPIIRRANRDDLAVVIALLKDCGLPYQDIGSGHLADFLIAEAAGEVAGTVGLERFGANALLRSLAVQDKVRGSGLGKRLIAAIENHARENGVTALHLLTTTAPDFFGRQLGYATIARTTAPEALQATAEFSSLCPSRATCMLKRLAHS